MRISIIGPGDIDYHFRELIKIPKDNFEKEISEIAKAISKSNAEIVILPDTGISFEIAKYYKKYFGRKVIATIPKNDTIFGFSHLKLNLNEKIESRQVIDEIINTENWYKHDLIKGLLGNIILYLGSSPGTNGELNYAIYLYKLITGGKINLNINKENIHREIKADENFTILVYQPFLINKKLDKETENYIKKFNINLIYVKNPRELYNELVRLNKLFN
jgi:hypothetical protein